MCLLSAQWQCDELIYTHDYYWHEYSPRLLLILLSVTVVTVIFLLKIKKESFVIFEVIFSDKLKWLDIDLNSFDLYDIGAYPEIFWNFFVWTENFGGEGWDFFFKKP
jgi:hypothetical protein